MLLELCLWLMRCLSSASLVFLAQLNYAYSLSDPTGSSRPGGRPIIYATCSLLLIRTRARSARGSAPICLPACLPASARPCLRTSLRPCLRAPVPACIRACKRVYVCVCLRAWVRGWVRECFCLFLCWFVCGTKYFQLGTAPRIAKPPGRRLEEVGAPSNSFTSHAPWILVSWRSPR
jgi:hypothetical protein